MQYLQAVQPMKPSFQYASLTLDMSFSYHGSMMFRPDLSA